MSQNEFNYELLNIYGKNVFISRNVEIRRPHLVSIGSFLAIDSGFYLTTSANIGSFVHIGPYVTCIGGATGELRMANFTTIAAGARLICKGDEHLGQGLVGPTVPDEYKDKSVGGKIVMETYSSIGTNAIIFPGTTIGEGSVVGAGAVLTKNAEPWTIYVGNPAKPFKVRESSKIKEFGQHLIEVYNL